MQKAKFLIAGIFLLAVLLANGQSQSMQWERVKVGSFSLELPTVFAQMSDDDIAAKILSYKKPVAFFSDRSKQADLSVNKSNSKFRERDTQMLLGFYKANVRTLYDSINFSTSEVQTIRKREYAVLEFDSEVKEKGKASIKKYNYVQYTIIKKEVWVFSFSCTIQSKSIWKPVAAKAMKSMKVS